MLLQEKKLVFTAIFSILILLPVKAKAQGSSIDWSEYSIETMEPAVIEEGIKEMDDLIMPIKDRFLKKLQDIAQRLYIKI